MRKIPPEARRRIQAAIEILAETPRPPGAKKLSGSGGDWRVRTGDYRIIYEIDSQHASVNVLLIGTWEDLETRLGAG